MNLQILKQDDHTGCVGEKYEVVVAIGVVEGVVVVKGVVIFKGVSLGKTQVQLQT